MRLVDTDASRALERIIACETAKRTTGPLVRYSTRRTRFGGP
jgi:hypothetical protein